ncbi:hypothetical protein TEU_03435 [Thermococcus eurythermalis]|uniref:Uncharacterized protein n=1 Tax=Thermococcus eurythermalis TaxID=1505907 RepID=A0A097QSP5_9EURY|nr:hypothetical protein [Thermococcus eurythermalis]AIU69474.1 hypothetical protein TEU_03435 [Thermococcus eurythermalis]
MIGERFNIHNKDWVKQVGSYVVFSDTRLGEMSLFGKLVYADDTTAVVQNSDVVIVSRTGYYSTRALEVYEELKDKIEFEEEGDEDFDYYELLKERTEDEEEDCDEEEEEDEDWDIEEQLIEQYEYKAFIEDHPPIEVLRDIEEDDEGVMIE